MYPDLEGGGDSRRDDPKELRNGLPEHNGAKDCIWALVFIVHLVVIVGLAVYGFRSMNQALENEMSDMMMEDSNDNPLAGTDIPWTEIGQLGLVAAASAAAGIAIGLLWLWLMRSYPKQLIIFTMVCQAIFWIASAVYMFYIGAYIGAIMGLIGAVFTIAMWWWWRHRIPFAAAVLSTVATVTRKYPGTIMMIFACLLVQAGWGCLWAYTSATSYFYASSGALGYILYVFFLLSFYWTAQVIKNTGHVTVCGTFATWYFMGGNNQNLPSNPTIKSAKRAMTTSFGSICFGSLIVALIQTVRAILRSIRNQRGDNAVVQIVICLVDCILGCIENLVRYFNKYAYVQVAMYGKSFCEAAKDTWKLTHSRGVDAMINDSFIGTTLTMGIMLGAAVCFLVGALAGASLTHVAVVGEQADYSWVIFGIVGALIGMVMMSQAMSVVDSGVATIFVAWAMDPEALKQNDSELAARFDEAWNGKAAKDQRAEYERKQYASH